VFINANNLLYATINSKLGRAEKCGKPNPKYKLHPRVTIKKYIVLTKQAAGLLEKSLKLNLQLNPRNWIMNLSLET